MAFQAGDVRIVGRVMDHARGAWPGQRPQWWTATHEATGLAVTWHDISDVSQHKLRDIALASLDLMVEEMGAHCPPLSFESKEGQSDGS